jgi:hypothetical protein
MHIPLDRETFLGSSPRLKKELSDKLSVSIYSEMPTYKAAIQDVLKISVPQII